ncbi:MAG: hypothetical protein WA459_12255 [Stellaceae bacterium]
MQAKPIIGSVAALRRKLRALASVIEDRGATAPEKANAEVLKKRLEEKLEAVELPPADWSDKVFRLGRWATELRKSTAPAAAKGDWTDNAHRLGKAVRKGYKNWFSE